jgi:hypothetical protein
VYSTSYRVCSPNNWSFSTTLIGPAMGSVPIPDRRGKKTVKLTVHSVGVRGHWAHFRGAEVARPRLDHIDQRVRQDVEHAAEEVLIAQHVRMPKLVLDRV